MRILVTGGAGFVGSHLVDALLLEGHEVICVDSFFSGKPDNVAHHKDNAKFRLIKHDVREPLKGIDSLDRIYHLACPASPTQYQFDPVLTLETSVIGTQNMLKLARRTGARMLYTSTSEAYGDPLEHPQKETYWGNVDTLGKRACYDEGKRAAETLCKDYHEQYGVDVRLVRIFNTYGPRMMFNDGRVLSNFMLQALLGQDITVHGDGKQTRSFMYVSDLVAGLMKRMEVQSDDWKPVNLGNPDERTIKNAAQMVKKMTDSKSTVAHIPMSQVPEREGDPKQRCADISRAKSLLGWEPTVTFEVGLQSSIDDFKERLKNKPRMLVFTPAYLPEKGPAEKKAQQVMRQLSGYEFDVITTKIGSTKADEDDGTIHIHRIGKGNRFDKVFYPIRAALLARKLHKMHGHRVAWAIMASHGALAAIIFSWMKRHMPVVLSVYEGKISEDKLKRGKLLSPLYKLIFRRSHRWQVIGNMSQQQQAWLEEERHVQVVQDDADLAMLTKRTRELFQEAEILSSRM
ncbi:MAG: NAD-dependent epimerase/dehydratase family protein [Candidatus Magasanikbacteria bacterium]|jgi:UDP-glucuronate decarboxylase|nr:NAD-dependent epimerase/dehydratase family protein [Candidatus Magasanikbacteria bacterium]